MLPAEILLMAIVIFGVALAATATFRVIKERESTGRTAAQLAFVWLFPFLGPMITIQLLRREAERGPGVYPTDSSTLEEGVPLNLRDAKFRSSSNEEFGHGDTPDDGH